MIYFLTVNYYSTKLVTQLISSIPTNKNISHQLIIVNNSPADEAIHTLQSESTIILESGKNLGYGSACNLGLQWIHSRNPQAIVWIINPDAYVLKATLEKAISLFSLHPELAIVGTTIYTPNAQVWFAGGYFTRQTGRISTQDMLKNTQIDHVPCDWVSGCSMLINLQNFITYPQFDSAYFLYYEDFDFCRRYASIGHLIAVTNQLCVVHQPSTIANRQIFDKIRHSTYSYLLTLEKYTNKSILLLRLIRLIFHALILLPGQPKVAFGKLYGVLLYLRRSLPSC